MAKKQFATLGIFAVLLMSLVMVSAAANENNFSISIDGAGTSSNPVSGVSGDDVIFTIDFETTNSSYPSVNLSWEGTGISPGYLNNTGNTSFSPTVNIGTGKSHGLKVYVTNENGDYLANLTLNIYYEDNSSTTPSTNTTDPFANYSNGVCSFDFSGEHGDLEITDFDINNLGKGDDEEWEYLDKLEIEVEIGNTHDDDDVRDVEVKLLILNEKGEDVTDEFVDDDVLDDIGKLKEDSEETVIFEAEVPVDVDAGDYRIYVVAYSDGKENEQCVSEYKDFTGDLYFEFEVVEPDDNDYIIIDENEIEDLDGYCGTDLEIVIPVYNLNDEDEEMVLVEIYNSELGLDKFQIIEDLNDGDGEDAIFKLSLPENLENGEYKIDIYVYFDWDDDEGEYDEYAYDENVKTSFDLNIVGCQGPSPTISANLESGKKKGEELIVSAMITNNGKDSDVEISVSGYESWADIVSVTPQSAYVAEGEFVEAEIVLMPKKAGKQSFKITAEIDGKTYNRPIAVEIEDSFSLSSLFDGNNTLYVVLLAGIGGVLVLILLILVVKVSKRRPVKPQF